MFNASNQSACIFSCFNFEQVPLTEVSTLKFNDRKWDVIKKRPNSFLSQNWKICCVKSFILVLQRWGKCIHKNITPTALPREISIK